MENTNAPKLPCDKCRNWAPAEGGEFFYLRSTEYFYCKACVEARKAK